MRKLRGIERRAELRELRVRRLGKAVTVVCKAYVEVILRCRRRLRPPLPARGATTRPRVTEVRGCRPRMMLWLSMTVGGPGGASRADPGI